MKELEEECASLRDERKALQGRVREAEEGSDATRRLTEELVAAHEEGSQLRVQVRGDEGRGFVDGCKPRGWRVEVRGVAMESFSLFRAVLRVEGRGSGEFEGVVCGFGAREQRMPARP